jgi:hypothetical protein
MKTLFERICGNQHELMMYQVEKLMRMFGWGTLLPVSEDGTTAVAEHQHLISSIADFDSATYSQLRKLTNTHLLVELEPCSGETSFQLAVSIRLQLIKLVTRDEHPAPRSDFLYRSPCTHWIGGCGTGNRNVQPSLTLIS